MKMPVFSGAEGMNRVREYLRYQGCDTDNKDCPIELHNAGSVDQIWVRVEHTAGSVAGVPTLRAGTDSSTPGFPPIRQTFNTRAEMNAAVAAFVESFKGTEWELVTT